MTLREISLVESHENYSLRKSSTKKFLSQILIKEVNYGKFNYKKLFYQYHHNPKNLEKCKPFSVNSFTYKIKMLMFSRRFVFENNIAKKISCLDYNAEKSCRCGNYRTTKIFVSNLNYTQFVRDSQFFFNLLFFCPHV